MHHNGSYPPVASLQPRQTAKHSRIFPLRGRFPHFCDHLIIMGHRKCWCQSIRNFFMIFRFSLQSIQLISKARYNKCLLDVSLCCDQQSFVWFCNHRIDLSAEAGLNPWSHCPVGALGQHYQSWCPVSDSYSLLISFNKQDKIQLYIALHSRA